MQEKNSIICCRMLTIKTGTLTEYRHSHASNDTLLYSYMPIALNKL